MNAKEAIRHTLQMSHDVLTTYLSDLSDAEIMIRPVPDANHIAWQMGHLVASEHEMLTGAGFPAPPLPDGFAAAHTKETSSGDHTRGFLKKAQYLEAMEAQRRATLAALDAADEADLAKAAPEAMRPYAPTIGAVFNTIGLHELMHAGQFVGVRRKLKKPVLM